MKPRSIRGRAFLGGTMVDDVVITFDRHILNVGVDPSAADAQSVDGVILPGFIDLHVHGAAGADFMDGTVDAVRAVAAAHARNGTTALAATTLSGSGANIRRAAAAISAVAHERPTDCADIAAIHFEGPYISPARAGAQSALSIRTPEIAEAEEFFSAARGLPAIMTVAPEIEGMHALMEKFHQTVIFSVGHSNASFGEALDAIARGARHVTHLFNAMTPLHHREPGVVGAALISEEVTAELIADGLHIHPAMLRYFARAMEGRACLVTDAMRACGMPPGNYKLYEHDVVVDETAARLEDGTLAGSVLSMIKAVQNMVELAGLPLEMVVPMATSVPARVIGVQERKGRIDTGLDADLVVISERFNVKRVFIRGRELALS